MKKLLLAIFIAFLAGCAVQPKVYYLKPGASEAEMSKDRARCDYETSSATQNTDYGFRGVFGQELDRAVRKLDLTKKCLLANGWIESTTPYAPPQTLATTPQATQVSTEPKPAKLGTQTLQAEQLIKSQRCADIKPARLVNSGAGFEVFTVDCANGDAAMVRCEYGNCRELK